MEQRSDLENRLDRLESREAIRGLAARYAVLVDARDIEALLDLYVDDFRVGTERGRDPLRRSFHQMLGGARFGPTIHFVGQHEITLSEDDADRAKGIVYCRAEHEFPDRWVVATLQYWDEYERRNRIWRFSRRVMKAFYVADVLERPNGPERVKHQLTDVGIMGRAEVPEAWPTWGRFQEATDGPG